MELFSPKKKLKLDPKNGIVYWRPYGPRYKDTKAPEDIYDYACHIAFYPNLLRKKYRHWGPSSIQYDGATYNAFGFWYFNFSWSIY
jgi:hypothetical protein